MNTTVMTSDQLAGEVQVLARLLRGRAHRRAQVDEIMTKRAGDLAQADAEYAAGRQNRTGYRAMAAFADSRAHRALRRLWEEER